MTNTTNTPEYTVDADGFLTCVCGNTPMSSGFETCTPEGKVIPPSLNSDWHGHYVCLDCDRVHQPCVADFGEYCECPECR